MGVIGTDTRHGVHLLTLCFGCAFLAFCPHRSRAQVSELQPSAFDWYRRACKTQQAQQHMQHEEATGDSPGMASHGGSALAAAAALSQTMGDSTGSSMQSSPSQHASVPPAAHSRTTGSSLHGRSPPPAGPHHRRAPTSISPLRGIKGGLSYTSRGVTSHGHRRTSTMVDMLMGVRNAVDLHHGGLLERTSHLISRYSPGRASTAAGASSGPAGSSKASTSGQGPELPPAALRAAAMGSGASASAGGASGEASGGSSGSSGWARFFGGGHRRDASTATQVLRPHAATMGGHAQQPAPATPARQTRHTMAGVGAGVGVGTAPSFARSSQDAAPIQHGDEGPLMSFVEVSIAATLQQGTQP